MSMQMDIHEVSFYDEEIGGYSTIRVKVPPGTPNEVIIQQARQGILSRYKDSPYYKSKVRPQYQRKAHLTANQDEIEVAMETWWSINPDLYLQIWELEKPAEAMLEELKTVNPELYKNLWV